jgi:hypothetical protein
LQQLDIAARLDRARRNARQQVIATAHRRQLHEGAQRGFVARTTLDRGQPRLQKIADIVHRVLRAGRQIRRQDADGDIAMQPAERRQRRRFRQDVAGGRYVVDRLLRLTEQRGDLVRRKARQQPGAQRQVPAIAAHQVVRGLQAGGDLDPPRTPGQQARRARQLVDQLVAQAAPVHCTD